MKRVIASAVLILLAVPGAAVEQQKLKFAKVDETTEPYHTEAVWAAGEIAKRTNNRYTMDVFPASQLGNETQINQSLSLGTVDLIYTGQSFAARTLPALSAGAAPHTSPASAPCKNYPKSPALPERRAASFTKGATKPCPP